MIMTKFDEDWTKIVDFLLVVYFLVSVIFYELVSTFHYVSEVVTHSGKYFPLCLWESKAHKVDYSIMSGIHGLSNGMQ